MIGVTGHTNSSLTPFSSFYAVAAASGVGKGTNEGEGRGRGGNEREILSPAVVAMVVRDMSYDVFLSLAEMMV
jgi:hypothetical protein